MRKLPVILLFLVLLSACKLDPVKDAWEYYEDWRNENNAWLDLQLAKTDEQGRPYYEKVVPEYDRNACIYIHYFNDRNATSGNLSPKATSTCDVKYKMELYNGTAIDSTYLSKSPADSLMRADLSGSSYISGFRIALMAMSVGDSCDIIIPYQQGYTNVGRGAILPYSHLRYFMKLVDIPGYERPAN